MSSPTDDIGVYRAAATSSSLDGVLSADWRTGVDQHLPGCDGCSRYLNQIRPTLDTLERLPG
jgi:predicted anti-sigma-YlaC factor YlaD